MPNKKLMWLSQTKGISTGQEKAIHHDAWSKNMLKEIEGSNEHQSIKSKDAKDWPHAR
jgi:hypothetical protein